MKNKQKSNNGIISFWKFVFAIMLVILHASYFGDDSDFILFKSCSIGVEYFYLVSGYFLANSALKESNTLNIGKDTIKFLFNKIKRFYPYVIIGFAIDIIIKTIYLDLTLKNYILSIWDLLLLGSMGLKKTTINSPTWFLSSMILSMLIIYPLIKKYKKNFIYIGSTLIVLLLCGYVSNNFSTLTSKGEIWSILATKGTLRAFLELNLGCIIYLIANKIKSYNFTKFGKIFITFVEIGCFIMVIYANIVIEKIKVYDYIMLLLLTIALSLAFSEKTLELKLFSNKLFYALEKISLPLFLVHHPLRLFFLESKIFSSLEYVELTLVYILVSLVVAIISYICVEKLKKYNFKKLFITN